MNDAIGNAAAPPGRPGDAAGERVNVSSVTDTRAELFHFRLRDRLHCRLMMEDQFVRNEARNPGRHQVVSQPQHDSAAARRYGAGDSLSFRTQSIRARRYAAKPPDELRGID